MRPHIARLLDELLDDVDASGDDAVDVMAAVAFPLPVTVIGEMLGIPAADRRLPGAHGRIPAARLPLAAAQLRLGGTVRRSSSRHFYGSGRVQESQRRRQL